MIQYKRVSMIGLGYIGLPTAALIASRGCQVLGIDVNPAIVATLNSGKIHIVEAELDVLLSGAVASGRFRASLQPEPADVFMVAVPTPFKDGQQADLGYIEAAANSIASVLKKGDLVILESTSPVGTTEKLEQWLRAVRPDLSFPGTAGENSDIRLAYCPERVLPGRIIHELVSNDRIIGGMTPKCAEEAAAFYRLFVEGNCRTTSARTAEMVKLTENAFRDVNIAFANELSMMAEQMGVDVWEVIRLANRHPRVNILQPGPGVGGHCIAVDPWFLVHGAPDHSRLIRTAREVNLAKTAHVIGAAEMLVSQHPEARVACLGLAFKPNIDDFRESPAVEVAAALARRFGKQIRIVEPYARGLPMDFAGTGAELIDLDSALAQCDLLIVLVDHDLFKSIPLEERGDKIVYDTRGLWPDQPNSGGGNRLYRAA